MSQKRKSSQWRDPEQLVEPIVIPDEELSILLEDPFLESDQTDQSLEESDSELVEPICIQELFSPESKRAKRV